jgi:NAD(P)-dependent dehydrogenase (short-subunit alcohol dehydrogenase family)
MSERVALVTGGTRGIGLGIATRLAAEGWQLAICGTRPGHDVRETVAALRRNAPRVEYFQADISRRGDRARLVAQVHEAFTAVNALVNNAGRAPSVRADVLEATEESFEELVRTNLQGPYFLTQAIARDMVERRRKEPAFAASIVFITSVSAELASINRGDYCVSKAGLAMTAKLFAARLAGDGIPVYEVRPGIIATDMTARVKEAYDQRIANGLIPEPRWGQPDDIGAAVAALLRGDFPYATGSVIHIDGGLALPRL